MLVATVAGVASGLAAELAGGTKPGLTGVSLDRRLPEVALLDEHGQRTTLTAFHGRAVVLAPGLTFCREICPITAGALEQVRYDVGQAGLARRVAVVEVSVDPWRDSPARLRAYRRMTGVRFHLLTGTTAGLRRFWSTFGVSFFPTGHGRSFDVAHTDGVFLLDPDGHLRIALVGTPNVHRRLPARLERLLEPRGRAALAHPGPGWTVGQVVDDLGTFLGTSIKDRPFP